ncbi:MAG: nucleotidyltransferase family protein [Alphaproteobacteria bacterium]|nr:nucleotidyltransferase family protein [Alphaproteobacteria bacterium]
MPQNAMVLAAGLGTRMRPLTEMLPKPLVMVGGRPLIDRTLDRFEEVGVEHVVINLHHKGGLLRSHLSGRLQPRLSFSDESESLLDTGGGVAKALPLLGRAPFFVANGDALWFDGYGNALRRMAGLFEPAAMDALLLLSPTVGAIGYRGLGDFFMQADGRLQRRQQTRAAPFVFTGVQLLAPDLFRACPQGAFSLNRLYDRAAESGRLFGLRHHGDFMAIDTLEALAEAEAALSL